METALALVVCGLLVVALVIFWTARLERKAATKASVTVLKEAMVALDRVWESARMLREDIGRMRIQPEDLLARLSDALRSDVGVLTIHALDIKRLINEAKAPKDDLYQEALKVTYAEKHITTTILRRQLGIGYKRATKLLQRMSDEKVITRNGKPGNYLPTLPSGEL